MHYDLSRKSRSTTKEQIYTYTPQKENNYKNPIKTIGIRNHTLNTKNIIMII